MRKELLSLAFIVLAGLALLNQEAKTGKDSEWESWKGVYGTNWAAGEEAYRKAIFDRNVANMEAHNANPAHSYKMGINQFTAMTDEEFFKIYLDPKPLIVGLAFEESTPIVGDINWVTKGGVSPIKNQGQCGSCWAFSATGVMESWALINSKTVSLSEQQLVDCTGSYGNQGCNGGWPSEALKYVVAKGIASESEYAYKAVNQACKTEGGSFKISGQSSHSSCTGLASALNSSPVSVTVDATNWSRYSSGVFSNCASSINHAVLLVASTSDSWTIKNSWGTSWGEKGFIRLATGNTCGLCQYAGVTVK